MADDFMEKARAFFAEQGLVVQDIVADDNLHRCGTVDKPRGQDGAYIVHLDGNGGVSTAWARNWHSQTQASITSKPEGQMSESERQAYKERLVRAREAFREEQERRWAQGAQRAWNIWNRCSPANDSFPYLQSKQVSANGLRMSPDGRLVVPVLDAQGQLLSLQFIDAKGAKMFLKDGKTQGGRFPIAAQPGNEAAPLLVGEGYATVATACRATGFAGEVSFNCGNLPAVAKMARQQYPGREIVLIADNDIRTKIKTGHNPGLEHAERAAKEAGGKVALCPAQDGQSTDFNDLALVRGLDAVKRVIEKALAKGRLVCVNARQLLEMNFPPREDILAPVFTTNSLHMVFAERGMGKTMFALTCACAVATGTSVFGVWTVSKPRKVLYIDGEMPSDLMQKRLASVLQGMNELENDDNLTILNYGLQENNIKETEIEIMPNLATKEGQEKIEPFLEGVSLIIIDSIVTLCRTGKSNDEDAWAPVQMWLMSLRRRGFTVLLVHHTNKNGGQRGTGAKEDVLDTVMELKRPGGYDPTAGAQFEVHFSKARSLYGKDVQAFEATLATGPDGEACWQARYVEDALEKRVCELLDQGATQIEVAEELGIHRSKVGRIKRSLEDQGHKFPDNRRRKRDKKPWTDTSEALFEDDNGEI